LPAEPFERLLWRLDHAPVDLGALIGETVMHERENQAREREKMALQLENILLRFERRLPPAPPGSPNSEPPGRE